MAGGRYAPGHVGEFTQHLPFEALAATKITQSRLRPLPSRVVVYLLLVTCLPEVGYLRCMAQADRRAGGPTDRHTHGRRVVPQARRPLR
ncbi:transposase domain-containing protein [Streptomyces sp. BK205]|uniref:transposase domain-containing protein n=1 Tax=Streptomyces sp. BK205 TaxID=2512164 RepID=UPI001FB3C10C|nr:transposase domain-containing protein [Streptomyces sp. BK205]